MRRTLVRPQRHKRRRARVQPPIVTRLPRRAYVIRELYLRRFRTLHRQLSDLPLDPDTTFDGLLNMGEDGNEIWVEAGLPEPEKRFTIIHELVHARRQRADEDLDDDVLEEQVVELESVARAGRTLLSRMSSGLILGMIYDYLTAHGRFNPNTVAGLAAVHRRIWALIGTLPGRTRTAAPAVRTRNRASARRRAPV